MSFFPLKKNPGSIATEILHTYFEGFTCFPWTHGPASYAVSALVPWVAAYPLISGGLEPERDRL